MFLRFTTLYNCRMMLDRPQKHLERLRLKDIEIIKIKNIDLKIVLGDLIHESLLRKSSVLEDIDR